MQHILIVEDDLDIQDLLRNFLQEVGYELRLQVTAWKLLHCFHPLVLT